MADMLLDVINYLKHKGVVSDDGVDAFRDYMPESPDKLVVLQEYGGSPTLMKVAGVNRKFQVKVRSTADDPGWAKDKCWEVFNTLVEEEDPVIDSRSVGEQFWGTVQALQAPTKIATDESNRVTYGFNVSVITYRD